MSRLCTFLMMFMLGLTLAAQPRLFFMNKQLNKMVEVFPGQQVCLLYNGYLNQQEFAKNIVTEITDSTITLGHDPDMMGNFGQKMARKQALKTGSSYKIIRIKDIRGFRRITAGRQLLKTATQSASIVGLFFLVSGVYQSDHISSWNAFFISFGSGIATTTIINALFPENIRYLMKDGWQAVVAFEAPKP